MAKLTVKGYSKALADLAAVPSQIAPKVAKRIRRDIALNFSAGRDPYRRTWAPLAKATIARGRHPPPLTDTWKGRRGVRVVPRSRAGIGITSSVDYMGIHQDGAPNIPARKFLPESKLPSEWKRIWQEELTRATKARLSRG